MSTLMNLRFYIFVSLAIWLSTTSFSSSNLPNSNDKLKPKFKFSHRAFINLLEDQIARDLHGIIAEYTDDFFQVGDRVLHVDQMLDLLLNINTDSPTEEILALLEHKDRLLQALLQRKLAKSKTKLQSSAGNAKVFKVFKVFFTYFLSFYLEEVVARKLATQIASFAASTVACNNVLRTAEEAAKAARAAFAKGSNEHNTLRAYRAIQRQVHNAKTASTAAGSDASAATARAASEDMAAAEAVSEAFSSVAPYSVAYVRSSSLFDLFRAQDILRDAVEKIVISFLERLGNQDFVMLGEKAYNLALILVLQRFNEDDSIFCQSLTQKEAYYHAPLDLSENELGVIFKLLDKEDLAHIPLIKALQGYRRSAISSAADKTNDTVSLNGISNRELENMHLTGISRSSASTLAAILPSSSSSSGARRDAAQEPEAMLQARLVLESIDSDSNNVPPPSQEQVEARRAELQAALRRNAIPVALQASARAILARLQAASTGDQDDAPSADVQANVPGNQQATQNDEAQGSQSVCTRAKELFVTFIGQWGWLVPHPAVWYFISPFKGSR